jgi:hypothetical protein
MLKPASQLQRETLADVREGAHSGLKSDIALRPRSAISCHSHRSNSPLIDHLVGAGEQRRERLKLNVIFLFAAHRTNGAIVKRWINECFERRAEQRCGANCCCYSI